MKETSAVRSTPLPPSVEKAYHVKCQQLKRRLNEIEEANDAARLHKRRIDRAILKMRLERAFLLERLAKSQQYNTDGADSDKSTSPPPTPQERPARVRRNRSPQTDGNAAAPSSPPLPQPPASSSYPRTSTNAPAPPATPTGPDPPIDRRGIDDVPDDEPLPLIHNLPNGTNVVILAGRPKQPPWTIRDIEPRHWLKSSFERKHPDAQRNIIEVDGYTPYDLHGRPVVIRQDHSGRYYHVFEGDQEYVNPVHDNVRLDDVLQQRQLAAKRVSSGGSSRQVDGAGEHHRHSGESRHRHSGRRSGSASGSVPPGGHRATNGGGAGFTAVNR